MTQHFIFFVTFEWAQKARVFVPGKPFESILMFASKARVYPSEASFGCYTLRKASGLACIQKTKLERPVRDKHSTL